MSLQLSSLVFDFLNRLRIYFFNVRVFVSLSFRRLVDENENVGKQSKTRNKNQRILVSFLLLFVMITLAHGLDSKNLKPTLE